MEAVVLAAPAIADILIAAGLTVVIVSASELVVQGVKVSIENARVLAEEAKRKRDNCNCKGLCHIDLRNPIGPSGLFQRHCIKCSNRKEAEERAANHMGHHPPISHAGHFHPTDGKGRKIPSYHYCYPPFH